MGASVAQSGARAHNASVSIWQPLASVVYTQTVIDSWAAGSEYDRLNAAISEGRTLQNPGSQVTLAQLSACRDDAVWAKGMAVLYAVDADPTRLAALQRYFGYYHSVTGWEVDTGTQTQRLNAAWILDNMTQAAGIVGYSHASFDSFLLDVCLLPGAAMADALLDWNLNPNWHGGFAAARLGIASHLGDVGLFADAWDYFSLRLSQSIYHSAYDGGTVVPLRNEAGSILNQSTQNHWNQQGTQINASYEPVIAMPDGTNAERTRDHGHVSLGLGSFTHGALTILASGRTERAEDRDRLVTAWNYHASRMLPYFQTREQVAPWPGNGVGGPEYQQGWFPAVRYCGADASTDLLDVIGESEVATYSASGANNLCAEMLADG